jgi:hypothetical protein
MRSKFLAVLIIILIAVVSIASYLWYQSNLVRNKQTAELVKKETVVKNDVVDIAGSWKTFTSEDKSVTFQYPEELPASPSGSTKYIRPQKWPPIIIVAAGSFSCNEGGLGINGRPGMTIRKTIDGIEYCIENVSEGAAGTFYTDYTYTFLKDNNLVKLEFTLAYPQCDNYTDPKKTECEKERGTFDLDGMVNQIARSVKFISAIRKSE